MTACHRGLCSLALLAAAARASPCLCVFDIDRTLTGRQGDLAACPENEIQQGIEDKAYSGGVLTLSAFAQRIRATFCSACYMGAVSAGTASGPGSSERSELYDRLSAEAGKLPTREWSAPGCSNVTSPLVTSCQDGHKQVAVAGILEWYRGRAGVVIKPQDVFFFDDRWVNVAPFRGLQYNAHQVSCATRDGPIGLCGATPAEVISTRGVTLCEGPGQVPREPPPCLCIFDIDRTLTGKQGQMDSCPANHIQQGIEDTAYGGGVLTLSALTQHINDTFCTACHIGTISAGTASGPGSGERKILVDRLRIGKLPTTAWSGPGCSNVTSPLVTACEDGHKQLAAQGILAWYRDHAGVFVSPRDVYFFDDRRENVAPFGGLPYNAHQVSCATRDGLIGLCGATPAEIVQRRGVTFCGEATPAPHEVQPPCLCIFDIDRTLTGKQGDLRTCPQNQIQQGVHDSAYGGGPLTLSEVAQDLSKTFCKRCYIGTISAGDASGPGSAERKHLYNHLSVEPGKLPATEWSQPGCYPVTSPLVTSCEDGHKQIAVPGILHWYLENAGVHVAPEDVFMFDDRRSNVVPFFGLPYNARQVSCATRDYGGAVGLCGATLQEIVDSRGVALCPGTTVTTSALETTSTHVGTSTSTSTRTTASSSTLASVRVTTTRSTSTLASVRVSTTTRPTAGSVSPTTATTTATMTSGCPLPACTRFSSCMWAISTGLLSFALRRVQPR